MANNIANVPVRSINDLTLLTYSLVDIRNLKNAKIPVGNLPLGISGESISLQQLLDLIPLSGKIHTGEKSYLTLENAYADLSNVPSNSLVRVLNDPDKNNNGLYHWDGSSLTKINDDSISIALEQLQKYLADNNSDNLFEFVDAEGTVVVTITKSGEIVSVKEQEKHSILVNTAADLDDVIEKLKVLELLNLPDLAKRLGAFDSGDLFNFVDAEGNLLLAITSTGVIRSPQLYDINTMLSELEPALNVQKTESKNLYEFRDANKTLLGYVDPLGNWILNGTNVLQEIIDIALATPKSQITALKKVAVKEPESIIQIYLTEIGTLPSAKGTTVTGKGKFLFDGQQFNCYVSLEVQGASSAWYAKKNWNIAFYEDSTLTKALDVKIADLRPHDELVFKSNWIDSTHTRNAMAYRLWEQIVATRTSFPRNEVELPYVGKKGFDSLPTGANGVPRLYPAILYINDEFYAIGSFGTAKKRGNYNIAKNKATEILIGMDGWNNITNLEVENPTLYELKAPSKPTQATYNAISGWNTFAQMSYEDFAINASTYLYKDNVIDFMIFAEFVRCTDVVNGNNAKNFQFISYNGKQFMFMPYDMDTIFGLHWAGTGVYDDTQEGLLSTGSFWRRVRTTYNVDIEKRYKQLRDTQILSVKNIYDLSRNIYSKYSLAMYDDEVARWGKSPSFDITNLEQIIKWSERRLAFLDTYFNYTTA